MDTALASETGCAVMADKGITVDPFLVEALQNPRHRLTILRMELDIQRFLQNPDQQQFEFQHFPTSYLRLAAHRVANHYGLITSVRDGGADGNGSRILVTKSTESRFPALRLSEIPAKQSEIGKFEHMKIAIKPRPSKGSGMEAADLEKKGGPPRSVEERIEDYDRARARIFNGLTSLNCNNSSSETNPWRMNCSPSRDENQVLKNGNIEAEKNHIPRESIPASRIAILRDREKDRYDPDYDRSYKRYMGNLPMDQNFCLPHFNIQKMGTPFYDMGFNGYSQKPTAPTSLNLGQHSVMRSPYVTTGLNQHSMDAAMYMQWPNAAAVMYTHSYEHFRNAPVQAQFYPPPLSFDYMQNR